MRYAVQGDVLKGTRLHHICDLLHHAVRAKRLLHIVHDARALLRTDHDAHPRKSTHLGGRDLRIAARHSDARRRIRARRTADDLAGLAVAQMRHRACIDDIDVRPLLERHDLIAARTKQPLHRLRLELIHLTAERHKCCAHRTPPVFMWITIHFYRSSFLFAPTTASGPPPPPLRGRLRDNCILASPFAGEAWRRGSSASSAEAGEVAHAVCRRGRLCLV